MASEHFGDPLDLKTDEVSCCSQGCCAVACPARCGHCRINPLHCLLLLRRLCRVSDPANAPQLSDPSLTCCNRSNTCQVSNSANAFLSVNHDVASIHDAHRCFLDSTNPNGCACRCKFAGSRIEVAEDG